MDADQHHGGSATLEYALADCALSQMATGLGETSAAAALRGRAGNWRRVWDAGVRDPSLDFQGFPRPRIEDGSFFVPTHGAYSPRSDQGFHEGTAWQYQWLVQDDVPGLVVAMGGLDAARARLDAFFAYDALAADPRGGARANWVVGPYSYYNQYRYNPNNEPDLHAPWMYVLLGQPWKTDLVVRAAQALFRDAPDGVTGNDDLGTMSAWYLFGALGMYPAVPGTGQLLLHAPRFPRVEIDLEGGRTLVLEAPGADARKPQYIAGVAVDGTAHPQSWIDWSALRDGGTVAYALTGNPPVDGWGTHPADLPVSPCATDGLTN
jgi:predicted alpha-1,2-mannosidase